MISRIGCPAFLLAVVMCVMCSCSNEENTNIQTYGHVAFEVSVVPDSVNLSGRVISLTMSSEGGAYSHTWENYRDISVLESFYAGMYHAKAVLGLEGAEGYGCECYIGESDFEVTDNHLSTVQLVCSLSQAKVRAAAGDALLERFPLSYVTVHSPGASYVDVVLDKEVPALVSPGMTGVWMHLVDSAGNDVAIDTGVAFLTEADGEYLVSALLADDVLSVSVAGHSVYICLDSSLLLSPAPMVECSGFSDGVPVHLTEGLPAESNILMLVESAVPLRKVMLSSVGSAVVAAGLPSECDILACADEFSGSGLIVNKEGDSRLAVDFTHLLENLSVRAVSDISFLLQAVDAVGRASDVAVLRVSITGVEMSVVSVSKAILGDDISEVTLQFNVAQVEGSDFSVVLDDKTTADVEPLEIISTSMDDDRSHMVIAFRVPEGISALPVRIDYMGKPRLAVNVERALPDFSFSVDAFANTVVAGISASTDARTSAITKYARVFAGGQEMAVLTRDIENGYLYCTGFKADIQYDVECVVLKDSAPKSRRIRTEKAFPVPDGSFEDVADFIKYSDFPSGGRYSATSFPIFNQQNFVDFDVKWPRKYWASINDKTFCRKADTHNTWYMQPSSAIDFDFFAAGSKSLRMSSVGWSLHGTEIPPYVQPVDAFESYNANYPPIDNISAGYLFLGDYSFNPADRTEVVTEGVKFSSRPSSLNGFFKYDPDDGNPSDRGWVKVELINEGPAGELTVIGSGYMEFPYAPDFRSFNIPISYTTYYTPATRLKILFCSSVYSDGLSFDDPEVPVSADIPNSRYIGSTLWIDNLSFSY